MNATPQATSAGRFNGRHMFAIMFAFFGVIFVVNFYMAHLASSTFTGEVVENSYVASQHFNRWLDEAHREGALGWHAAAVRDTDGRVAVALVNVPNGAVVNGTAWHPLGRLPDHVLHFAATPDGRFVSAEQVPAGRWTIRLEVVANGRHWRTEEPIS